MIKVTPEHIQQRATVKIVCGSEQGTGIAIASAEADCIYILTARHVLHDKKDGALEHLPIAINNIMTSSGEQVSYLISSKDNVLMADADDLAVIVVKGGAELFDREVASQLSFIDNDYGLSHCVIRGYPAMAQGCDARLLHCEFDEFKLGSEHLFSLHTKQLLDSFSVDANANVKGFSGGGVFFIYENRSYLLGLITDYSAVNVFTGIHVGRINTFLAAKGLPLLSVNALVVDERVKNAIAVLNRNNASIQAKISETIGDLHIIRDGVSQAADVLRQNQLLVLFGTAGIGKSAFAKEAIEIAIKDSPAELFVFNGEQFSAETIDDVLHRLSINLSFEEIMNNPAFQPNKIIWLESVEKLLETDRVEAFDELLAKAKNGYSVKIVVTVRKYSVQQFNLKFGWKLPKAKALLEVEPLSLENLRAVGTHFPAIQDLLSNEKIKHLIKIPFYLKYAVNILPALNESKDLDEQSFKTIIWDEVIDRRTKKRGAAFEALAVKRAKEMALFTTALIEPEIITSLYQDNLIATEDDELKERYTPAHDVLEDWALMRHVKRNKKEKTNPVEFFKYSRILKSPN